MTKTTVIIEALKAVLAALILLDVVQLTDMQLAGIVLAISTVLGALVVIFDPRIPWGATTVTVTTPSTNDSTTGSTTVQVTTPPGLDPPVVEPPSTPPADPPL